MAYSDLPETILRQRYWSLMLGSGRGFRYKKEDNAARRLHNFGLLPNWIFMNKFMIEDFMLSIIMVIDAAGDGPRKYRDFGAAFRWVQ